MIQNAFARLLKISAKSSALALCLALSAPSIAKPKVATASPAANKNARPAMWVVRDKDSTLYLFGTMHALSPTTVWNGPAIKEAMAGSEEVWFETEPPTEPAAIQSIIMQFGIDKAKPLSTKLSSAEMATFSEAIGKMGMKIEQVDAMRPWFAAMNLAGLPLIEAGYDQAKGADPLLMAAAKASGKRIRTFETPEQQMRFFADLSPEVELDLLRETLKSYKDGPAEIRKMEAAWARGDDKAVWTLGGASMKTQFPAVYAALISDRNRKWADTIAKELEGKGTDFIAVGSLHLVGPDSVQSLLKARGYSVKRK
jgi:uncharacterized protein YbaP (TraB family)